MRNEKYWQQGQALLLVVMIMVVSLTIGLSVATRSITNVRNSTEEADSQKAFSAAEAGVEQALKEYIPSEQFLNQTAKIKNVNIEKQGGKASFLLNGGDPITKDEGIDLWLSDPPNYNTNWTGGTINIDWRDAADITTTCTSNPPKPALEVIVLSGANVSSATFTRYAVDPCSRGNNFTLVNKSEPFKSYSDVQGTTVNLEYRTSVTIPSKQGFVVRIIPIYNNTVIGVTGDPDLPIQGSLISSTGQSGQSIRKIQVFQQKYTSLPAELFRYALLAP